MNARPEGIRLDPHDLMVRVLLRAAERLARYHRHRVIGLEQLRLAIQRGRRVLLVGNHAFDPADALLLSMRVYRELGCVPHFVGHRAWFRIPWLREFMARNGVVAAGDAAATSRALRDDRLLMLYPGGNREGGMRSYRAEPYTLHWAGRLGFVRLALEADADLIFIAALGIDEAYYQTRLPVPRMLFGRVLGREYAAMRLQLGLAGPHLLPGMFPLPVRLTHFLSPPLELGDRAAALRAPDQLAALHELLWKQCQAFLDGVVARREEFSDPLDRWVRAAETLAARAGL